MYNLFNSSAVLEESNSYWSFREPERVVGARMVKFSAAVNFWSLGQVGRVGQVGVPPVLSAPDVSQFSSSARSTADGTIAVRSPSSRSVTDG
jgi:hypothetical protein